MITSTHRTTDDVTAELTAILGGTPGRRQARDTTGGPLGSASSTVVVGSDPVGPSPHRIADASAAAIAAFGREVAALDEDRGAPAQTVTVDAAEAYDQLRAPFLSDLGGVAPFALTDDVGLAALNGFYPTRDGWVFLLGTYPHLRNAVCTVLGCPPLAEAVADAAVGWDAVALEEAVVVAGGVAAAVRTAAQWAEHPVGRDLAARPVVEVDRLDDAASRPLPDRVTTGPWAPLEGVRVLDNTHVIAGPTAARLLATFGADVLHTSTAARPDPIGMLALTGGGKRSAYADLIDPAGREAFDGVAGRSDVVISSYRNMARRGLGAADLAARHPGVVVAELHCWGGDGPWAARGGFDQLACAATGFALEDGHARSLDGPDLPPTHLLNDYLAAHLVAAGVVAALRRRAVEGGSWRVRVNLARACTWVRELGMFAAEEVGHLPAPERVVARHTVIGPMGALTEPVVPITFSGRTTPLAGAPTLPGTAALAFAG